MPKRQKWKITLENGETAWITGATISDAFQNGLKRYGSSNGSVQAQKESKTVLLKDYAAKWWTTYKEPRLKISTKQSYLSVLSKHIYPYFGGMSLNEITTETVQRFYNENSKLAMSTAKHIKELLHQILDSAIEDGLLERDCTESKRLSLPTAKKDRESLTSDEYWDILRNLSRLKEADALLVAVLAYTGMRRGEMLGLQWQDIDTEQKLVSIERNVTYSANKPIVGTPKSRAGYRKIPIPDELTPYLCGKGKEAGAFIIGGGEMPMTECAFKRTWERIERTIDMHGATPHVLRHTYATILGNMNTDVKSIQRIMGHSDSSITLNRYMHSLDEGIIAAGKAFSSMAAERLNACGN